MKNTRCFEIWSLKLGHVWESWRNTRGHIFSNRCSQCLTHFAKVEKTFDRFLQDKPQELTMSLSTLVSLKMTLTWLWNILRWHFDSDPMYLMYLSSFAQASQFMNVFEFFWMFLPGNGYFEFKHIHCVLQVHSRVGKHHLQQTVTSAFVDPCCV